MVSLPYIDNRQETEKHSNLAKLSTEKHLREIKDMKGRNHNIGIAQYSAMAKSLE